MASIALNDKIFTQVALQAFVAKLAPLNAFTRDFSGDARRKGDAIVVPLISGITATTFNQSYEVGGGAITLNLNVNGIGIKEAVPLIKAELERSLYEYSNRQ